MVNRNWHRGLDIRPVKEERVAWVVVVGIRGRPAGCRRLGGSAVLEVWEELVELEVLGNCHPLPQLGCCFDCRHSWSFVIKVVVIIYDFFSYGLSNLMIIFVIFDCLFGYWLDYTAMLTMCNNDVSCRLNFKSLLCRYAIQ